MNSLCEPNSCESDSSSTMSSGLDPESVVFDEPSTAMVIADESSKSKILFQTWDVATLRRRYPTIKSEIVEKVVEGFETILELYFLYGLTRPCSILKSQERLHYQKKINNELNKSANRMLIFLQANGEKEWMNYFKYKTLAFYAYYETEKTDLLPPLNGLGRDLPGVIFSGFISEFVKLLRKKDPKMFSSFIVSMNVVKTGLPRPTDDMIEAAEDKCAEHLTNPAHSTFKLPADEEIFVRTNVTDILGERKEERVEGTGVILNKDNIIKQLKRTVREIFREKVWTEKEQFSMFYPSTSANYNYSRGKAGAVGAIYEEFRTHDNFVNSESLIELQRIELQASGQVSQNYGEKGRVEQECFDNSREETLIDGVEYDLDQIEFKWRCLFTRIYEKAKTEVPLVKPVGLAEALKVRVISKGPPLLYTAMKPFQKFLWKCLKTEDVFELIGKPVNEDIINKVMGIVTDDEIIVNGDYKASTDNLHSWVSEAIAEELILVLNENSINQPEALYLDDQFKDMLIRSLTGHIFEMRDGSLKKQTEGQLMGSITSFPFLCIANAAFCRWALELANNKIYRVTNRPLDHKTILCPLRVNGDDCTMKGCRKTLKDLWLKITAFGGLSSSQGKTLFSLPHKPICVINSQTYDYDNGTWIQRKLVNSGLLLGKVRSVIKGSETKGKAYSELGTIHRELKKNSPPEIWKEVSSRFIKYNKDTLSQCPNIPWEAPEYLGGPGLCLRSAEMSYIDRACATIIIMNTNSTKNSEKIRRKRPDIVWRLHDAVQDRLKEFRELPMNFQYVRRNDMIFDPMFTLDDAFITNESTDDNYSKLYKALTIETLFTKKLKDIYKESELHSDTTLKHNDNIWAEARKSIQKVQSLRVRDTEDILYEKKYSNLPTICRSTTKLTVPPDTD